MAADRTSLAESRLTRSIVPRRVPEPVWVTACVVLAAAAGVAAGGAGLPVAGAAVVLAACTASIAASWRPLILAGLLYLPFSGLPILILHPNTAPGVLAKDFLFVIPAYVGAAVAVLTGRERLSVPGVPLLPLGCLVALVLVQALNPEIPNPLVALIGLKVWLFYVPMLWLGYHFAADKQTVQRLLKAMVVVAMVPCVIGIAEAILAYGGYRQQVYALYGSAGSDATQQFAGFQLGGGAALVRLPSIFQFISQYWLFCTATIALAYAAWRGNRSSRLMAWLGPTAIAVAVLASMTSGLRAAFLFSPFLLLLIAVLDGARMGRLLAYAGGSAVLILGALLILRVPAGPLAELVGNQAAFILELSGNGFRFAIDHATLGLGTGVDTNGISYAFGGSSDYNVIYATVGNVWQESWYVKTFLELGIVGLVVLLVLLGSLIRRSLHLHRSIVDPELRSMSAAFVALFLWNVVYAVKVAYVDLDPMAIYIWFFLGMQWRLAAMAYRHASASPAPAPAP